MLSRAIKLPLTALVGVAAVASVAACQPVTAHAAAGNRTYYVDCAGNDASPGTTTTAPWKTLAKASKAALNPGDAIALKRGCTWEKQLLDISASGTAELPITVGAYGTGAAPRLRNATYQNVRLNGSHVIVQDLELGFDVRARAACGQPIGDYSGIVFSGTAHHNTIRRSHISGATQGVFISANATHNTVEGNTIVGNNVMKIWNGDPNAALGAFGILINGSDNLIARNTLRDNVSTCASAPNWYVSNSIEIYGGSRNKIRHNRSSDRNFSELGSSSTRIATGTEFSYNLFTPTIPQSRFVITRGSGEAFGPVPGTIVDHNTVYQPDAGSEAVVCGGGCDASILTLSSNILWAEGKALYADGAIAEGHNLFWSSSGAPKVQIEKRTSSGVIRIPIASSSRVANPRFVNPARPNFTPAAGSPAIDAGRVPELTLRSAMVMVDLANKPVPQGGAPDIGGFEYLG